MAGAMRKMAVYLGLVEVDDRNRYDDEDDDAYGSVTPVRSVPDDRSAARSARGAYRAERSSSRGALAVEPQTRPEPLEDAVSYRITTLHPRTYNEARTIGEHFRDGTPVIMNLTEMSDGDAKRLVDFAAGLSFGLRGGIERVTAKVFLLSPENVEVTAEDKARIAEGGFFNQS